MGVPKMTDEKNKQGFEETMSFKVSREEELKASDVLSAVYAALLEKGYNPINQLVGYLISGDPAYITNHKQARSLVRRVERDDLLEELVSYYVKDLK